MRLQGVSQHAPGSRILCTSRCSTHRLKKKHEPHTMSSSSRIFVLSLSHASHFVWKKGARPKQAPLGRHKANKAEIVSRSNKRCNSQRDMCAGIRIPYNGLCRRTQSILRKTALVMWVIRSEVRRQRRSVHLSHCCCIIGIRLPKVLTNRHAGLQGL